MNNEINSVEDIDAMLDSQYGVDDNATDEVETENSSEASKEPVEEETDSNEENTSEDEETEEETTTEENTEEEKQTENVSKKSKEEKEQYSFKALRTENAQLKEQLEKDSVANDTLKRMAEQYGYSDVNKFVEAYENARIMQEAKQKGYDPELYKQLQDSNKRIEALERENREVRLNNRASKFKDAVEKFVGDYNLGEDGRNEIFTRLENEGYDVETILSLPNPEVLVRGIMADKIVESSKQKQIEKMENLNSLADEKHDNTISDSKLTLDDIIKNEMKEYKKANFL